MRTFRYLYVLLVFNLVAFKVVGDGKIDSLQLSLLESIHDTTRISTYLEIGDLYESSAPDSAMSYYVKAYNLIKDLVERLQPDDVRRGLQKNYADVLMKKGPLLFAQGKVSEVLDCFNEALNIYSEINNRVGMARSLNNLGFVSHSQGDIATSLEYFKKSIAIRQEIDDKNGMAAALHNIGAIYNSQGNVLKGLEYFTRSLKIREELDDKRGIAESMNNIGFIYRNQGDIDNALEIYKECLSLYREINDKRGIATSLNNIGFIYNRRGDGARALDYYNQSLSLHEQMRDNPGIARALLNLGDIYHSQNRINEALENYSRSLRIYEGMGDKNGMSISLVKLGFLYLKNNEINKSIAYGERAIKLSEELGFPDNIERSSNLLKNAFESQGNYQKAYSYFKKEISMRDSISNEANLRETMRQQARYEYDKKAAIDSINHAAAIEIKEIELTRAKEERQKQQAITYALVLGIILILSFSMVLFRLFLHKREANRVLVYQKQQIENQNTELNQANEEISSQRDEIASQRDLVLEQKKFIERQNGQITDSITYAQRIQQAILPNTQSFIQSINGYSFTDSFVLYKPKDMVSGDFYWVNKVNGSLVVAIADCTGHGVPGAIMSMLGVSLLNEVVNRSTVLDPSEILHQLRTSVKTTLHQTGKQFEASDGMSMAIIIIDFEGNTMQYASSYIPLYHFRNGKLSIYKADRSPIGIAYKEKEHFKNHTIDLQENDTLYLLTDGFTDQFSDEGMKKFKSSRLQKLLSDINTHSMSKQKDLLEKAFESWKGTHDQIDDVTAIGLRV